MSTKSPFELCSCAVNTQKLLCCQKAVVKCSYYSFLVYKILNSTDLNCPFNSIDWSFLKMFQEGVGFLSHKALIVFFVLIYVQSVFLLAQSICSFDQLKIILQKFLVCLFNFIKKNVKNVIFNFSKRGVGIWYFYTNAVNMTGTFNVTLKNLMSFCQKP